MKRVFAPEPLTMIVTQSHPPVFMRWLCFALALSMLIVFAVTGVEMYRTTHSGEAVYRSSRRSPVSKEITRESHPEKFRELQTRRVISMGFEGVIGLLCFRFFRKLGE